MGDHVVGRVEALDDKPPSRVGALRVLAKAAIEHDEKLVADLRAEVEKYKKIAALITNVAHGVWRPEHIGDARMYVLTIYGRKPDGTYCRVTATISADEWEKFQYPEEMIGVKIAMAEHSLQDFIEHG